MIGALVTVDGDFIVVVVALIGKDKEIGLWVEMKAISIWPEKWLHDRRERNQVTLMQDGFGHLEGVRNFNRLKFSLLSFLFKLLLLLSLKLFDMVSLDLLKEVIAAKDNLFSSKAYPRWV
jgi:hypothetical protein